MKNEDTTDKKNSGAVVVSADGAEVGFFSNNTNIQSIGTLPVNISKNGKEIKPEKNVENTDVQTQQANSAPIKMNQYNCSIV